MAQVKTTIVIPEDVLQQLKITAVLNKTTVSKLLVNSYKQLTAFTPRKKPTKDPLSVLGKYRLKTKKLPTRAEMYDEYLKRKMGF